MNAPALNKIEVEALTDWLGSLPSAFNAWDDTDEPATWVEVSGLAAAILASDWLAAREAQARAEARDAALVEAAEAIEHRGWSGFREDRDPRRQGFQSGIEESARIVRDLRTAPEEAGR